MLQRGDDIFIRTGKRARFKHIADGFVINKQPGGRVIILIRQDTAELRKVHAAQRVIGFGRFVGQLQRRDQRVHGLRDGIHDVITHASIP